MPEINAEFETPVCLNRTGERHRVNESPTSIYAVFTPECLGSVLSFRLTRSVGGPAGRVPGSYPVDSYQFFLAVWCSPLAAESVSCRPVAVVLRADRTYQWMIEGDNA